MIKIRSSADVSAPTLVAFEATLSTPNGVYAMSCDTPLIDSSSLIGRGLFGPVSWPQSRFRLAPGVILEQHIFLPHDGSAVAFSWQLRGDGTMPVRLTTTPFFAGCGPRSYRDVGFRFQSQDEGGRLAWLPNVLGPKIIADTTAAYQEEIAVRDNLVAPGTFEFELSHRPSVLIFSNESVGGHPCGQQMGAFLAGLMPRLQNFENNFVSQSAAADRHDFAKTVVSPS